MTIHAVDIHPLSDGPADMDRNREQVAPVVNVASRRAADTQDSRDRAEDGPLSRR